MSYSALGQVACDHDTQDQNGAMMANSNWQSNYDWLNIQQQGGVVKESPIQGMYGAQDVGDPTAAGIFPCDLGAYNAGYMRAFAQQCSSKHGAYSQNGSELWCAFATPGGYVTPPAPAPAPRRSAAVPILAGAAAVALLLWAL